MKTAKLTKLWINDSALGQTIHADFSNDMHYMVLISLPGNPINIATALDQLADMIAYDKRLELKD